MPKSLEHEEGPTMPLSSAKSGRMMVVCVRKIRERKRKKGRQGKMTGGSFYWLDGGNYADNGDCCVSRTKGEIKSEAKKV